MSLPLILTTAGRAAIVNAQATGTLPITLNQVRIGSSSWTPSEAATALQAQIKSLSTAGGGTVGPATIHVTASDSTTDTYTVREIGVYTSSGVLFAIYSQADPILTKGSGTTALIAIDIVITGLPANAITVTGTSWQNPQATETVKGVAEIATDAEVAAETDDERIVTPYKARTFLKKIGGIVTGVIEFATGTGKIRFGGEAEETDPVEIERVNTATDRTELRVTVGDNPAGGNQEDALVVGARDNGTGLFVPGVRISSEGTVTAHNTAKAWVNFNATGTPAIREAFNVSSVTYLGNFNGCARFRVNFINPMPSSTYAAVCSGTVSASGSDGDDQMAGQANIQNTTYCDVGVKDASGSDNERAHVVSVAVFAN